MYKIIKKKQLNSQVFLIEFEAEDLALAANPGQFVILRVDEFAERFPLTLYDFNPKTGTITVVCQAIGVSTKKLCALSEGDSVVDIAGPLGRAEPVCDIGKVIFIGGGVGTAEVYPIAKAMKRAGNDVTVIIGFRTKDLVICEQEINSVCDNLYVSTDDGSYGRRGFVTDILSELLETEPYDLVYAIGPIIMMKMVSAVTKLKALKTIVSLNSIMIDGTGMCGGCRIKYNGQAKFTCVDGPSFDGHLVDYDDVLLRQGRFKDKEDEGNKHYEHNCRIGLKKDKGC
ncbi:MAG: sulfide/dihydroorotate dehydrogenase-like FAD/NAD-binding protein [Candidatus Omnitrophica bacterium]|nr:sulfide/dihydroorotate dehydrogenase-like FAD/NAD-binding protein [Candidatus Omnitrophota bacterium]